VVKTIAAIFDGTAFLPTEPVPLQPNTHVRITIESTQPPADGEVSFLDVARTLNLDGPPDWAANLEEYLYGKENSSEG
jgi:hypothetical protein